MKREGTIGAATLLAIAAVVGFSVQSGPKPAEGGRADGSGLTKRSKPSSTNPKSRKSRPGCGSLQDELQDFLEIQDLNPSLVLPESCYAPGEAPEQTRKRPDRPELTQKTSHLKFVVATLPDPVHTHLPVLFDQFAVAIQEGAQDEKYDFDSAWLPWDNDDSSYALLDDQKKSNDETEQKEEQPGIILFRKSDAPIQESYREGLVVFVVGEEATQGIHKAQFRNALAWIRALQPGEKVNQKQLAILGPTFSGSLPSLAQLLSEPEVRTQLDLEHPEKTQRLAIYSGSVSGKESADGFADTFRPQVLFHSFVQSDPVILQRFCRYIKNEQPRFQDARVAIISEDETAYGRSDDADGTRNPDNCLENALRLYYLRDISALRGAYQNTSLFNAGASSQPGDVQRKNLPSDLADSAGKVHDSIRSYGGGQTPLNQEAFLLEIVAALQELHARYIVLRSSNVLDQLFLTNFLRRNYTDGRVVILGSDLMFIRERGSTGLNGVMTLSTYPLFPLERDWTEHQSLPATDRAFSGDTTEGTYVALRLLLNNPSLNGGKPNQDGCHVHDDGLIFVPPIACTNEPPIPDYSPTFWTLSDQCGEMAKGNKDNIPIKGDNCFYPGPATWLSVIGVNRYWPMAALTFPPVLPHAVDARTTERGTDRDRDPLGRPEMPLTMKVGWLILVGFAAFHLWCCGSGSYTAKPAFRAYFASAGEFRHATLVFCGSCLVAFLGIVAGWGCGVFARPATGLSYPWFAFGCVIFMCLAGWAAVLASNCRSWKLAKDLSDSSSRPTLPRMTEQDFWAWNYGSFGLFVAAIVLFCRYLVIPVESQLVPENRALTYWRAMHLTSGVSPAMPIFLFLVGLYLAVWYGLHGLALFGQDRPRLPLSQTLKLKDAGGHDQDFLIMFSEQKAAVPIEKAAMPLSGKVLAGSGLFLGVALAIGWGVASGVPVRSLGAENYAKIFVVFLLACCTLALAESWRLYEVWEQLRRLLSFLDRVPLRRTMSVLRGFSWESVWKMSGNVLEVRYKVISRQIECMNHMIQSLDEYVKRSWDHPGARESLDALHHMQGAIEEFAKWYSKEYAEVCAGDLTTFGEFQKNVAQASGVLFAKLLVPAWRKEKESLLVAPQATSAKDKDEAAPGPLAQSPEAHIRNAEEFVCLNYLSFVQNVLGRLRTMAMTIVTLFLAATIATSTYPFDPRQGLSAVLIVLFVIAGVVIVKVYAEMHRDATLSHVTNTTPGELGTEFWFKIIGFGFAPLVTLLTRVFPGITDFVFAWLQPGVASLK